MNNIFNQFYNRIWIPGMCLLNELLSVTLLKCSKGEGSSAILIGLA